MFLLLKETERQSRYVTHYTADYDTTKRQILQRLIPINDAFPHTICQDYEDVEPRGTEKGDREGRRGRKTGKEIGTRRDGIHNNESKSVERTLHTSITLSRFTRFYCWWWFMWYDIHDLIRNVFVSEETFQARN